MMFHVSRRDMGASAVLTPRVPISAAPGECHLTPRVCFAPTVEQCVVGLLGFGGSIGVTILAAFVELAHPQYCPTVYITDEVLHQPETVSDFAITGERWALEAVRVSRIGFIDCAAMVRDKQIVVCPSPNYVDQPLVELARHISDSDRALMLSVLEQ